MKLNKRDFLSLTLLFIGYYSLTRKEYKLPNISIFIPNTSLFTGNTAQDEDNILDSIKKSIKFKFITDPKIGWLMTIGSIYGIPLNIQMILPWDIFIAIPQIKEEIGKNIKIEPKYFYGTLLGYNVKIENAYFYA